MNIICFGQQPCGFFPKRFLVAKINTARKLQQEIGGKIVFFYHDSDADFRETITILRDLATGAEARLNFTQENKLQKKYSPLYLKRIPKGWKEEILKQLPRFVDQGLIDIFSSADEKFVADFCLQMYQKMGLLDGIEVVRSSDKNFREKAALVSSRPNPHFHFDLESEGEWRDPLTPHYTGGRDSSATLGMTQKEGGYFADVEYQGEIVRAKIISDSDPIPSTLNPEPFAFLHEGGGRYTYLPKPDKIEKSQISAAADERLAWMQSVINCTHYIYGEGEKEYLKFVDFPDIQFIEREKIDNSDLAWLPA